MSLLGYTSLGSTSSQTASPVSGRAQQRAAGCWETLSFHHVFPVGFLATFSGTFSSLLPPRISPNGLPQPVPPIPTLARLSRSSPHPFLPWTPSLVFSQFHVPSPFLRFLSTQPQAPFHDPTTPSNQSPFRTQLIPSKTVSSPPTPSVLHCIDSYSHFRPQAPAPFLSRPTRILPFLPLVPPCFSLRRLSPPTPPSWHAPSPDRKSVV